MNLWDIHIYKQEPREKLEGSHSLASIGESEAHLSQINGSVAGPNNAFVKAFANLPNSALRDL